MCTEWAYGERGREGRGFTYPTEKIKINKTAMNTPPSTPLKQKMEHKATIYCPDLEWFKLEALPTTMAITQKPSTMVGR